MAEFDIVLKDGMIFDGARNPRFKSDLGIKAGRIVAMGHLNPGDATSVIDASGLHVAPGFIDLHTHYDAQIFWDPYCSISSWHGITSLVLGNCGFGFAPVAPDARDRAMLAMTRNEAIPLESMQSGMPWDWVSFPEYLDSVDRTPKAVNVLSYMGLTPMLIWVLGLERAKAGVLPTDAEHAQMRALLHEAMDAGACGWSVQRTNPNYSFQRDYDGTPMVTDVMHDETAIELAKVLAERNEGFIQMSLSSSRTDPTADRLHTEALAEISRRPVIWNALFARAGAPIHRGNITWLRSCLERGLRIYGQTMTGEVAHYFTFEDWNEWDDSPAWRDATIGTIEEKLAKFADPSIRESIKANPSARAATSDNRVGAIGLMEDVVLLHTGADDWKQYENLKVGDISNLTGKHPVDVVLDLAVADIKTSFFWEVFSASTARAYHKEVVDYEYGIAGVSDGGAHTKFLTAGRYPTEYLTKWVRDAAWLSLEDAHWRLSGYPAACGGFRDRGVIREGAAADIVVYDYGNLEMLPQEVVYDIPGGEWRRVQRARGYRYILVNGRVTIEDDKETATYSGELLRHGVGPARTVTPA